MYPSVVSRRSPIRFRILAALVQALTMDPCFLSICQCRVAHNRLLLGVGGQLPVFLTPFSIWPETKSPCGREGVWMLHWDPQMTCLYMDIEYIHEGLDRVFLWQSSVQCVFNWLLLHGFGFCLSRLYYITSWGRTKCTFPRTSRKIAKCTKSSVIKERCNLFFSTY